MSNSTTQIEDVEKFLNEFAQKMEVFEVYIERNRSKNLQTMLDLELSDLSVREHLKELKATDYYRGPTKDAFNGPDLWEFGKQIKAKEVYIKISIGNFNKPVLCISFHYPEKNIKYPFK